MNILLLGKEGQVGLALQRALSTLGQLSALGREQLDLTDLTGLKQIIAVHRPHIIVNAAAYTAVDKAESEPHIAQLINATAVKVLAEEAQKSQAWLIHYSTDYVFDGTQITPYQENAKTAPLNVYGHTKLAGENAIRASACRHLIFRTSWVYSLTGSNFPLTILRRALTQEQIDVVSDSIGTPTSANLIADVTALALYRIITDPKFAKKASGLYHLVASGQTSWYEYAQILVTQAREQGLTLKLCPENIHPVRLQNYPTAAKRPQYSTLDNSALQKQFNLRVPHWQIHIEQFLTELIHVKLV